MLRREVKEFAVAMELENYLLDIVRFKEQIQEAIDVIREWQQKQAAEKTEIQWIVCK